MITKRIQAGFSMIELLVAVLVMGIGVLGITGLQMVSLQNNRGALVRAEAVQLAYDMMDRIRANPGGNYGGVAIGDPAVAPALNCNAVDCPTEANMTAFDLAVWKCSLGDRAIDRAVCNGLRAANVLPPLAAQPGLPSGDGAIAVAAGGIVTITVQWQEPNQPNPTTVVIDSRG